MNRPPLPVLAAACAIAAESYLPLTRPARYAPPADPGHFRSNGARCRPHTADDARAFRKRVKQRRAKKGYR